MTDVALPSGIQHDELDEAVRPQDDLFRHVNGKWIDAHRDPRATRRATARSTCSPRRPRRPCATIIEEAQQRRARHRGAQGRRPVRELHGRASASRSSAAAPLADAARRGRRASTRSRRCSRTLGAPRARTASAASSRLFVDNDPGDPERYLVFLEQGGLGLPDERYYREEKFAEIRTAYRAHLERMLGLAGLADAGRPRRARLRPRDRRSPRTTGTTCAPATARRPTTSMTWADVDGARRRRRPATSGSTRIGVPEQRVRRGRRAPAELRRGPRRAAHRGPARGLEGLAAPGRSSARARAYLSHEFVEANFDFYGTHAHRHARAARALEARRLARRGRAGRGRRPHLRRAALPARGEGRRWTSSSPTSSRPTARASPTLEWMSDETRERALDKLDKFTPKIGYPVKWRDYSTLEIDAGDLVGNVRATDRVRVRARARQDRQADRPRRVVHDAADHQRVLQPRVQRDRVPRGDPAVPVLRRGRGMPRPTTARSARSSATRSATASTTRARKYDGDGRLTDWWTEADRAAFEERTEGAHRPVRRARAARRCPTTT